MRLVDQWVEIQAGLPDGWESARLTLATEQPAHLSRAAQVLAPLHAGRAGSALAFTVTRGAGPNGAQLAARLFQRLDEERTWCTLRLSEVGSPAISAQAEQGAAGAAGTATAAASWDAALTTLPSDWADLLCEVEIESSSLLDRTALLCAPLNPARDGSRRAFTFRCSSRSGYGVSASMARRCLERLDEEGIPAVTRVLRVLSDTDKVDTQGPVWLVGGKTL